jgi:hypothetical protein
MEKCLRNRRTRAVRLKVTILTPQDPLQRAYFNGYALRTYPTTPFLPSFTGVTLEEQAPWIESGEIWRRLRAFFPPELHRRSREQDFYFDADFLLRRHDFRLMSQAGLAAAQLIHDKLRFRESACRQSVVLIPVANMIAPPICSWYQLI